MNKKPLNSLLSTQNYNETLFKQSISLVQATKTIMPLSKMPLDFMKTKFATELKKKQQTLQMHLSKTIKLFGQILGVSKNSFGSMAQFSTQIFDELTDTIETSCQSYIDKKKNIKLIEKQKQNNNIKSFQTVNKGLSIRPQDKYPFIKPAIFDHHSHSFAGVENIILQCEKVQVSQSMNEPYQYIDTRWGLQKMITQLSSCRQIAVDVEHSTKSYEGLTCLIQISSRYKDYIIDVFPIWGQISLLKKLIENQNIIKIMHGAQMDTKWLQRDFNIHIKNIFDTYKASRVLGYPKFSYAYLLHHYCDVATDKRFQLADWRERPLNQAMLNYARIDTHYLLEIWDKLLIDISKQAKAMNLEPIPLITEIYKNSHDVTLNEVELFSYRKKQIYQTIKNDTKTEDFEIIQTVFWIIDKVAKDQDEAFDDLIHKRLLTDVIARVKDLLQNRKAATDTLRIKIDRLVGVIRSHKHEKVSLILFPLKKQLQKFFIDAKKQRQIRNNKQKASAIVDSINIKEVSLIEKLRQQSNENIKSEIEENKKQLIQMQRQEQFKYQKSEILVEQLDYPLKTYENFTIQQKINLKKSALQFVQFQPIMTFLSKKFNIQKKIQVALKEQADFQYQSYSDQMELEGQNSKDNQKKEEDNQDGFLEFKRIKPDVLYTVEQQSDQEINAKNKPRKKRKEFNYEQKLRSKQGNVFELLDDI